MNSIYRKSFVFQATRFEEYQNGKCISQGNIDTEILAKVVKDGFDEVIVFNLRNNRPIVLTSALACQYLESKQEMFCLIEFNMVGCRIPCVGLIQKSHLYATSSTICDVFALRCARRCE